MKEFVEKLIQRLEEEKFLHTQFDGVTPEEIHVVTIGSVKKIAKDLVSEYNNGLAEKLLEAKKNCGEDSDCSECPFGQIEDRCILQELQFEHNNEFCEWEIVSDKDIHREYNPMCSEDGFVEITGYFDYEFCPYCGKKIKVVDAPYKKGE